jgi:hypothetical protein
VENKRVTGNGWRHECHKILLFFSAKFVCVEKNHKRIGAWEEMNFKKFLENDSLALGKETIEKAAF